MAFDPATATLDAPSFDPSTAKRFDPSTAVLGEPDTDSLAPETAKAVNQSREANRPTVAESGAPEWVQNAAASIKDLAAGFPKFAATLPKYAYTGMKVASGVESPIQAAGEAAREAIPQGVQMAKGLQSPVGQRNGSIQFFRQV
jgi:hypothetical protein